MTNFILLSLLSYFLGSICFAHLIAKLKKVDLSKTGSKSATSTNLARSVGWKWGILTAVLDLSKGVIPVLLALRYLEAPWQIVIVSILPVLGHIYPVFFNFVGGKGGATFMGIVLALVGLKIFLIVLSSWILVFAITRVSSITNIIIPWLVSLLLFFNFPFYYFIIGVIGATLVSFALRNNIKRLITGKEPKSPINL